MIYAEVVGDGIELNTTYTQKELVRAIPGSRFHSPPPVWTVPLTWAACKQLRATFGLQLEIGPDLRKWAEHEFETRVKISLELRETLKARARLPLPTPQGLSLRDFQEADVEWMLVTGSGLLMNPTGSGKTISVLTWMRNRALDRVLVISPAVMKKVWQEEAAIWYPELEAIVVEGTAKERREKIREVVDYGGLLAINFEALRTHSRLAPYGQIRLSETERIDKELNNIAWDAVIVDEAHRLADPKSKQTRASWAVGRQAKHRWALTATPITKGLDTIWPSLHFAAPDEWPSRMKFVDRYCQTSMNFWGGQTVGALRPEMEAEFTSIFDTRSRRLPKEVVLPQLPPIVRIRREVEMTEQQALAYVQMAEYSLAQVMGGEVVVATSTAAQYTRLGQFASSMARIQRRENNAGEIVESVELELPSNKIETYLSDLQDWEAQDEAVITFATSRRLIELLSVVLDKKKKKHSKIVGGQSEIARHEQITAFQRGDVGNILVVIAAGGSGISLTRGRIMAFLQRSWSRVEDLQAEGRGLRIGSEIHESVLRVDYVTPGTVDVGQLDVLAGKDDMLQGVLRDAELIKRMVYGGRP